MSDTENDRDTGSDEDLPGITHRLTGAARRAVGMVGRATRGALGRPEVGTDALLGALHAEHEETNQLFEKLMAADDARRASGLWTKLSVSLLAHLRAEQETVYVRLAKQAELAHDLEHSTKEHDQIERLLAATNRHPPGSDPFREALGKLQISVRHHVDDEETELLPKAAQELSEEAREQLVDRFRARKVEIEPGIASELGKASGDRSVAELRKLAAEKGIAGRSRMSKAELVAALEGK